MGCRHTAVQLKERLKKRFFGTKKSITGYFLKRLYSVYYSPQNEGDIHFYFFLGKTIMVTSKGTITLI